MDLETALHCWFLRSLHSLVVRLLSRLWFAAHSAPLSLTHAFCLTPGRAVPPIELCFHSPLPSFSCCPKTPVVLLSPLLAHNHSHSVRLSSPDSVCTRPLPSLLAHASRPFPLQHPHSVCIHTQQPFRYHSTSRHSLVPLARFPACRSQARALFRPTTPALPIPSAMPCHATSSDSDSMHSGWRIPRSRGACVAVPSVHTCLYCSLAIAP